MNFLNGVLQDPRSAYLRSPLYFLLAVALVAGAGCSKSDNDDDPIVATYENGVLFSSELDHWLTARKLSEPPGDLLPEIEELLLVRVFTASAVAQDLDDDPKIAHKLQNAEDALLERALKRHTAESVTVPPEEEVDEIVARDPLGFDKPRRARVGNLFKRFPPDASDRDRAEIRRRMEDLHEQLTAGADMAALALAESDSETRYRGGRMGTIKEGELPPALDTIVMSLAAGELSEIIESRDGLTIIKCEAVFEEQRYDTYEVRAKVEANIVRTRRRQAVSDLEAELLRSAGLEIFMDLALDPASPPDLTIARFGAQDITRSRLEELAAARRRGGRVRHLSETQAQTILEAYAVTTTAAERAREMGLVDDELVSSVRHNQDVILATEELGRRVRMRFTEPTEVEVKEYYEANRVDFRGQPEIDLEMIRFPFMPDSPQEAYHRARRTLDAIDSDPSSFTETARRHAGNTGGSSDYSMLTLTGRQLAGYGPAVGKAIQSLEPGEISRLIRQDNDFWIIKLVARRAARQLEYEEASKGARRRLGQLRVDRISAAIESEILADLGVEPVGS